MRSLVLATPLLAAVLAGCSLTSHDGLEGLGEGLAREATPIIIAAVTEAAEGAINTGVGTLQAKATEAAEAGDPNAWMWNVVSAAAGALGAAGAKKLRDMPPKAPA